ncbi:unnamed protein product, partial [Protopolystoma xenopodis]
MITPIDDTVRAYGHSSMVLDRTVAAFAKMRSEDPGITGLLPTTLLHDLLVCGNSISLLRALAPKHQVLLSFEKFPGLHFPEKHSDIDKIKHLSAKYLEEVQLTIRKSYPVWQVNFLVFYYKLGCLLILTFFIYYSLHLAVKRADFERKQRAFIELKEAARQNLEAKKIAKIKERQQDNAVLDSMNRSEKKRGLLIADIRDELIQKYAEMTDEVDSRIRTSEFRVGLDFASSHELGSKEGISPSEISQLSTPITSPDSLLVSHSEQ